MVFAIRMTPLPFAFSSYFLGLTTISLKEFVIGTIPCGLTSVFWFYLGYSLRRITKYKDATHDDN